MTPRQAAVHVHCLARDMAVDELRQFNLVRLAFSGDEKAIKEWVDSLDLPK